MKKENSKKIIIKAILKYIKNYNINDTKVTLNPSEIILIGWFGAQETCIIINVANSYAA